VAASIIHPNLLTALKSFYPSTVTIQQDTGSQDAAGQPSPSWSNLAGHVNLPCAVAPISPAGIAAIEPRTPEMTVAIAITHISLRGSYPAITPKMRAVVTGGQTYNILGVEQDSQGKTTRLKCEVVSL
jgi:hypothetical protein